MTRKTRSVSELAAAADLDNDEILIRLWDEGLTYCRGPRDRIRNKDLDTALQAVGLPTKSEVTVPAYWMTRLRLTREDLFALLARLGVPAKGDASTLPRGSVAKLLRHAGAARLPSAVVPTARPPQAAVAPPFQWSAVGHAREVRRLEAEEVEAIHWELVRDFADDADPIDPAGVRSQDLLKSAVYRQHTALGEEQKYPSVEMTAAALFHAIVHDHPFHNGNKRTALVSMLVLLEENGLAPTCDEDSLFELVLRLAQHKLVQAGGDLPDREVHHVAGWLRDCTRAIEKGDRPLQWRRLKQILRSYGCDLSVMPGNRMNITRVVTEKGRFGRVRSRTLGTQVKYADDGRQAPINALKEIRRSLSLDEPNGVDSADFYRQAAPLTSAFIATYRKTLKRLARL